MHRRNTLNYILYCTIPDGASLSDSVIFTPLSHADTIDLSNLVTRWIFRGNSFNHVRLFTIDDYAVPFDRSLLHVDLKLRQLVNELSVVFATHKFNLERHPFLTELINTDINSILDSKSWQRRKKNPHYVSLESVCFLKQVILTTLHQAGKINYDSIDDIIKHAIHNEPKSVSIDHDCTLDGVGLAQELINKFGLTTDDSSELIYQFQKERRKKEDKQKDMEQENPSLVDGNPFAIPTLSPDQGSSGGSASGGGS